MRNKLLLILSISFLYYSCTEERDPFLITRDRVGVLTKDVKLTELDSIFEQDSVVRSVANNELYSTSNEIEILDKDGNKLLLLEPVQAFDSTSTVGFIQVLDPRFQTAAGLGTQSTFKDIVENYSISRIENTLSAAVVFLDDLNIYVTIDKKELPVELRYDTDTRIRASQIPDDAQIKYFMIDWD